MKALKNPWPASVWQLKWSGNSSMSPRNLPFGEDYFYYHCMVYGDILDGSLLLLGSLYVNIWFIDITINLWLIYVWWCINSIMVHYCTYYYILILHTLIWLFTLWWYDSIHGFPEDMGCFLHGFLFCHRGRKGLRKLAKLQRRGKHRVGLREANTLR